MGYVVKVLVFGVFIGERVYWVGWWGLGVGRGSRRVVGLEVLIFRSL